MGQDNKTNSLEKLIHDMAITIQEFENDIMKTKDLNAKGVLSEYLANMKIQYECLLDEHRKNPNQELTEEKNKEIIKETVERIEEKYLIQDSRNIAENMTKNLAYRITENEQINEIDKVRSGINNYYHNSQKDINAAQRYESEKTQELQEVQKTIKSIEKELQILQNEKNSIQKESLWQKLINLLTGQQSKAEELQAQIGDVNNYLKDKRSQQSFILDALNKEIANNPENVLQQDGIYRVIDKCNDEYDQQKRENEQQQFIGNDDILRKDNSFVFEKIDMPQYDEHNDETRDNTFGDISVIEKNGYGGMYNDFDDDEKEMNQRSQLNSFYNNSTIYNRDNNMSIYGDKSNLRGLKQSNSSHVHYPQAQHGGSSYYK